MSFLSLHPIQMAVLRWISSTSFSGRTKSSASKRNDHQQVMKGQYSAPVPKPAVIRRGHRQSRKEG